MSTSVEESIEVNVPARKAYEQWTQFESFPKFMDGVEEVRRFDDVKLHWRAEIGGVKREWEAKITEEEPGERIAWTSTSGAHNAGVVTFHHLDDQRSKVMLQLEFEPEGIVESAGDALGVVGRRAKGDLERFKEFVEASEAEKSA